MRLLSLRSDDSAVSPVIGVILMVAITVVLAAVIGTFVLGLGGEIGQTAPNTNFQFDYDSGSEELTVTHDGGEAINEDELFVDDQNWAAEGGESDDEGKVKAGDSFTKTGVGEDETVRVVWEDSDGDASQTLRVWNA